MLVDSDSGADEGAGTVEDVIVAEAVVEEDVVEVSEEEVVGGEDAEVNAPSERVFLFFEGSETAHQVADELADVPGFSEVAVFAKHHKGRLSVHVPHEHLGESLVAGAVAGAAIGLAAPPLTPLFMLIGALTASASNDYIKSHDLGEDFVQEVQSHLKEGTSLIVGDVADTEAFSKAEAVVETHAVLRHDLNVEN